MANATGIRNVSTLPLALPFPYEGMLPAGQQAVVGDTPAQAQFILGGNAYVSKLLQFIGLPTSTPLTTHGSLNLDELLATAAPALSLTAQTTRFDLSTAGANILGTLANGLYLGQRKRLINMSVSANKWSQVTPATMAESRSNVKLMALYEMAELEWQSAGWKVVALVGASASVV